MTKLLPSNDAIFTGERIIRHYFIEARGVVCFVPKCLCLINEGCNLTEIKMRKTVLTMLGASLIAASTVQMAAAAGHHTHRAVRAPMPASERFRNANDSLVWPSAAAEQYWSDYSEGHVISAPAGR